MLPFRGRLVVFGGAALVMEPVSHYLGLLATTLGDVDAAVSFLSDAIALEEEMGALPFLANSLVAYASALDARSGPGDADSASSSRRRARSVAERLGMTALLARIAPPA